MKNDFFASFVNCGCYLACNLSNIGISITTWPIVQELSANTAATSNIKGGKVIC